MESIFITLINFIFKKDTLKKKEIKNYSNKSIYNNSLNKDFINKMARERVNKSFSPYETNIINNKLHIK